jgi:hypothetical protein
LTGKGPITRKGTSAILISADGRFLFQLRDNIPHISKSGPLDQSFCHAAPGHGLEQLSQQIAIAEAAMPILGENRVVRYLAVEAQPTEPAVSQVQMNLLAQPLFGTNAVAVANQQHPDEQFGINRRPASRAVKWRQVAPNVWVQLVAATLSANLSAGV